MTIGGFLENQAGVGRGLSVGPTTDFGDAVGAGITREWTQPRNFGGAMQYMGGPLNERNDTLKQRLGKDVFDLTEVRKKYPNPTPEGRLAMLEEANALVDDVIAKGRREAPEKFQGIKTTAEIKAEALRVTGANEKHFNEMMIRNPSAMSRTMGGFIGSATGAIIDPVNLATLPFGAGEVQAGLKGFQAARAVMKAAAVDGVINAGVEVMQTPLAMKWSEEMGHKYGFGEAAESVALSFVGGAGLSGLIRGAVHGLNRPAGYLGSVSADILDRIAASEKLPVFVRDAAAFLSRQAYIDDAAPPGLIQTGEDLKVHRDTAQRAANDFENYRPAALSSSGDNVVPLNRTSSTEAPRDQALPDQTSETAPPSSFSRSRAMIPPSKRTGEVSISDMDTSTNKLYHRVDNLASLKKAAKALAPDLEGFLKNVTNGVLNARVYGVRVKETGSLGLKLKRGKGVQQVSDYIGGRIVVDTPEALSEVVDRLRRDAHVIELEDALDGHKTSGYRAVHVQVMSDKGVSAEIQIQPREIRDVQDEAHIIYKKWQNVGDEATPEQMAGMLADKAKAKKMFDDAWAKWQERTGGGDKIDSFSDMAPAERMNELDLPEGLSPEVSADRVAIAESDLKALADELGDEDVSFALDDGRTVSFKDYADEIQGKKALIEAMNTCRVA